MKTKNDPATYRKMTEPYESYDAMVAATDAFVEELTELRKKHKVPNVLVVGQVSWVAGESESSAYTMLMLGDGMQQETLAAYAFGYAQKERQEMIAAALGQVLKSKTGKGKD